MYRWIVFWYGPLFRNWEVEYYSSEREARRVARGYSAQSPHNTYCVARVCLQIDATEAWTPPERTVKMTEKKHEQ